jgi:hypothetical protein
MWRSIRVAIAVGLILTIASGLVRSHRAVQRVEGEGFCATADPCVVHALGAGFPVPYLVDRPEVSVPHVLHLVEDDFRTGALLIDLILYFLLALAISRMASRIGRPTRAFTE